MLYIASIKNVCAIEKESASLSQELHQCSLQISITSIQYFPSDCIPLSRESLLQFH